MPTLHVAAMPFPSVQGTQAAVRAMVQAEHEDGRGPELLTYAHGSHEHRPPWPHHRIRDLTRDRSLRSGPWHFSVPRGAPAAATESTSPCSSA